MAQPCPIGIDHLTVVPENRKGERGVEERDSDHKRG